MTGQGDGRPAWTLGSAAGLERTEGRVAPIIYPLDDDGIAVDGDWDHRVLLERGSDHTQLLETLTHGAVPLPRESRSPVDRGGRPRGTGRSGSYRR